MKGFTKKTIPAIQYLSCENCEHLVVTPYLFGMDDVQSSYHCAHPNKGGDGRFGTRKYELVNEKLIGSGGSNYRIPTPDFCPYLDSTIISELIKNENG